MRVANRNREQHLPSKEAYLSFVTVNILDATFRHRLTRRLRRRREIC